MASAPRGSRYVGRAGELARLDALVDDVAAGRRRVLLVGGEAGIGKTRTVSELAERARARGARVLWGRCPEAEGAPDFWPFVQMVRAFAEGAAPDALRSALSGAEDLARLVPELGARVPGLAAATPALDASQARFRLFDAAASFARRLAREAPLLLVFDDLHFADPSSLRLLEFVARDPEPAALGIACTWRDTDVTPDAPAALCVAELARAPGAERVMLRGLEEPELATYLEHAVGVTPSAAVLADLHRRSEGNPFFAAELLRLLAGDGEHAAGPAGTLPPSVRAVVGRRLERLPAETRAALEVAAVVGREFSLPRLELAAERTRVELLERLEPAVAARVVEAVDAASGRYRFAHAVIREVLYDGLPLTQRLALHERVGKAIEALHGADRDDHLAELAHHFCAAAPLGHADVAVEYARRAAERACERLGFEEAALLYRRALDALGLGDDDSPRRCDLLVGLGVAQHRSGAIPAGAERLAEALALAQRLDDPERILRAILGPGWFVGDTFPISDLGEAPALERALARIPGDSALVAEAVSFLATRLFWVGRLEEADRESARAVAIARRVGDPRRLGRCLEARHWVLGGPDHLAEREALAGELLAVAEAAGDVEMQCAAHRWRATDALERGDGAGFERELAACASVARRTRQPFFRFFAAALRALDALVSGRLEEAERRAQRVLEASLRSGYASGASSMATLLMLVRWHRGDLEGALALTAEGLRQRNTITQVLRVARAAFEAEAGRPAEGRAVLEEVLSGEPLPRNRSFTGVGMMLARICERIGAVDRAPAVYALLEPYADRNATIGLSNLTVLSSVASPLGGLSALLGRYDEAERHLERAVALETRTGSQAWLALTQLRYARMLAARGRAGRPRARAGARGGRARRGPAARLRGVPRRGRGALARARGGLRGRRAGASRRRRRRLGARTLRARGRRLGRRARRRAVPAARRARPARPRAPPRASGRGAARARPLRGERWASGRRGGRRGRRRPCARRRRQGRVPRAARRAGRGARRGRALPRRGARRAGAGGDRRPHRGDRARRRARRPRPDRGLGRRARASSGDARGARRAQALAQRAARARRPPRSAHPHGALLRLPPRPDAPDRLGAVSRGFRAPSGALNGDRHGPG